MVLFGRRNVRAGPQLQGFCLSSGNRLATGARAIFTCLPLPLTVTECGQKNIPEGGRTPRKHTRKSGFVISHHMEVTAQRILPIPVHPGDMVWAHPEGQSPLREESQGFVVIY